MDSPEQTQRRQEESFTVTVRRSTRNALIAKLITAIGLTVLVSGYWISDSAKRYEAGKNLTQEKYLEKFEERKAELIAQGQYANNPPLSALAIFIPICFLIGSYELLILVIGLLIGKLIRR